MARRVITIEEKIERQTAEVTKARKKYDGELLNKLIEKKERDGEQRASGSLQ